MALSENREVKLFSSQALVDIPVDANVNVYKGAFVGMNASTGLARPLAAGDEFLGLALKSADNTIAGNTAGGINARLHQEIDIVHALSGVAQTNLGDQVYASDDETLTLTSSSNTRIGRIVAIEAANLVRVRCEPLAST